MDKADKASANGAFEKFVGAGIPTEMVTMAAETATKFSAQAAPAEGTPLQPQQVLDYQHLMVSLASKVSAQ